MADWNYSPKSGNTKVKSLDFYRKDKSIKAMSMDITGALLADGQICVRAFGARAGWRVHQALCLVDLQGVHISKPEYCTATYPPDREMNGISWNISLIS